MMSIEAKQRQKLQAHTQLRDIDELKKRLMTFG